MNFFKSVFSDDPDPNTQGSVSDSREHEDNEDNPDEDSSPNAQKSNQGPYPGSPISFFKSIFSDEPELEIRGSISDSPGSDEEEANVDDRDRDSSPNAQLLTRRTNPNSYVGGGWNFGGLVKSLATKSESVIETYKRDLKEFGTGLKKETEMFREVASQAVKELPTTIDAGASKAQASFATVWKETSQIIAHGKDALLAMDQDADPSDNKKYSNQSFISKHYSRFDARVREMQSNLSTFSDEPEDLNDYNKWNVDFSLEGKNDELERLFEENGAMEEIYKRIVPNEIDHETFWIRYFYKVHKLELADDARVKLLKKAISVEDDEDLSWDVDDDDDEKAGNEDDLPLKANESKNKESGSEDSKSVSVEKNEIEKRDLEQTPEGKSVDESQIIKSTDDDENEDNESKSIVVDSSNENISNEKSQVEEIASESKSDEKNDLENNVSDLKVASDSKQPLLLEEEELEWDEIENLSSGDEKKASESDTPSKINLPKRISVAEEDEDLRWDIEEDDDEAIKP